MFANVRPIDVGEEIPGVPYNGRPVFSPIHLGGGDSSVLPTRTGPGIVTQPVARTAPTNDGGYNALDPCTEFGGPNCPQLPYTGDTSYHATPSCPPGNICDSNGTPLRNPAPSQGNQSTNPSDCTGDPMLCDLLSGLNNTGSGASYPGLGAPTGTIGPGAPTSSNASPIILVFVVGLGVLGYYLWHKYKGKLAKHEEA